jgi:Kef-type K+ transport system membrane component KefB
MFFSGMEIDPALFRRARSRSLIFGLINSVTPLLLGTGVGLWCGYELVPSIAVSSLLASHTLLARRL